MSEHEQRTEDKALDEQETDVVEDLHVPEGQGAEVAGGNIVGAWPKKIEPEQ